MELPVQVLALHDVHVLYHILGRQQRVTIAVPESHRLHGN